jgi:phosphoribosyl 1,2-cyclic phosphate phosphodiesterase
MSGKLEFTILGSGSSGGVPRADGNWGDCDPAEPKNTRTRCSMLVRRPGGRRRRPRPPSSSTPPRTFGCKR